MSTTTENYNLIIPEGDDLFAPLNVEAPNFRSIDSNMWDNRLAGIQAATELISGSVHAITRETPDAPMFRYTATGAFNNGDTFTVDGISVQAVLPNGIAVEGGAYIEGCEVLAAVVGSKMTLYIGAGSGDADTLEGHPASYFGTAQRTEEVAALAQAANTTANAANSAAQDAANVAAQALAAGGMKMTEVWSMPSPYRVIEKNESLPLTGVPSDVKFFIICLGSTSNPNSLDGATNCIVTLWNNSFKTRVVGFHYGLGSESSQLSGLGGRREFYLNGINTMVAAGCTSTLECVPHKIYAVS